MITILLQLGWFAGWLLGVIGFFSARSALAELRLLRATLAQSAAAAARPVAVTPVQQIVPDAEASTVEAPIVEASIVEAKVTGPPPPLRDFEALLTTNWGVWLGSAALSFAAIFLVRYAVEQELLGPALRCGVAALLGLVLLGAAEFLRRHEGPPLIGPLRIDQAPGGLAAGGTAMLFGAAYGAGPYFGLLPPVASFACMAAASLIALAAALRYGRLTAATGLAGAFATPALVATHTPSLPGLFAYLFVVSAAALLVVRRTGWGWLGWATTAAGAAWVCFAAIPAGPDRWAAAAFVPASAALSLVLLPGAALDQPVSRGLAWVPFAAMGAAGLVLENFVPGLIPRLALFLFSPIAVWKGVAEPRLDRLPWIAALIGLLTLLFWTLPAWVPLGVAIHVEGIVQAILPSAWAPLAVVPLSTAAALFAAFHAAAGLWLERRTPHALHWAALVAAVPVLSLAVTYARIARFQTDLIWASVAFVLAGMLTITTASAWEKRQRAGVHAAGAVAALALGCAMLLHDNWLTMAISLFLPALAGVEARAALPALRRVGLVVAALVIVRLTLNWYVLDYAFGPLPLLDGLLAGYGVPALAFAFASVLFRRRGDDTLVATLEAGSVSFLALFTALEIRRWSGGGSIEGRGSFPEAALHLLTIAIQATAYQYLAERSGRVVLDWAWRILGGLAVTGGVTVVVLNPMLTGAPAGVFTLIAAYLAPCCLAAMACRRLADERSRQWVGGYAVVAGFTWITLQIRQCFHPGAMSLYATPIKAAELWGWSGGWLAYGIGLMALALHMRQRRLRLTALGVIGLVCAKVFVMDMSGLSGLWRVLSFLGLGLALIGLGVVYRRFVLPEEQRQTP